jgi:hypothetical protein
MCCVRLAQVSWRPTSSIPSRSLANYTSFRDELLLFGEEQHVKHIIMISFLRYLISSPKKVEREHQPSVNKARRRRENGKPFRKTHKTATPEHKIE